MHFLCSSWRQSSKELCCYSGKAEWQSRGERQIFGKYWVLLQSGRGHLVKLHWPHLRRNILKVVRLPHHVKKLGIPWAWSLKCTREGLSWETLISKMAIRTLACQMANSYRLLSTSCPQVRRNTKACRDSRKTLYVW